MDLKRLDWDSRFFGLEVFGVHFSDGDSLPAVLHRLRNEGANLAYLFVEGADGDLCRQIEASGGVLYDQKITYGKELPFIDAGEAVGDKVEVYRGVLNEELLQLAFVAGHDSRFRKDSRLRQWFEPMYRLWIENSVNGAMADRVFIYRDQGAIEGMITCKIRPDETGSIGLIATAPHMQGKGVGSRLVQATEGFYQAHGVVVSTVVTQRTNRQACHFYERIGFSEYKTEHVYHLWFN
jgi:dTDP-4-amino-4,6-dideoxy-D-galactose acyltransferase